MRLEMVCKILLAAILFLAIQNTNGWAIDEDLSENENPVLILQAVPVKIEPLKPPAIADAVEDVPNFTGLNQIVSFQIEKVIEGSFETYDSQTSAGELSKAKFSVAVKDASDAFEISTPEDLGLYAYRLYFKRYKQEVTTFILINSEKIS
ncbi:MAG: hypothetical protein HYZ84_06995 [Candidatus Omnitrophica bacterium]|nr:hypothetical protein [Candidatus Omnitrophota bacterium]